MFRIGILTALIAVLLPVQGAERIQSQGCFDSTTTVDGAVYYGGGWASVVPRSILANAPRWDPSLPNPPLPPGQAVQAAKGLLPSLLTDGSLDQWQLGSISLRPIQPPAGAWIYVIEFSRSAPPPKVETGSSGGVGGSYVQQRLQLAVLMDGKPVAPVRSCR